MAELVLCLGFFIIYLIEALVHRIFGLEHGHSHQLPAQNTTNKNSKSEVENGRGIPIFKVLLCLKHLFLKKIIFFFY